MTAKVDLIHVIQWPAGIDLSSVQRNKTIAKPARGKGDYGTRINSGSRIQSETEKASRCSASDEKIADDLRILWKSCG